MLVTGAGGFIGGHLVALLSARGHVVHAVSSRARPPVGDGVVWHQADLLAPGTGRALAAAVGAESLVHLAWSGGAGRYRALDNFRWVAASLELLDGFAAAGGRRLVAAGTCAEYRWDDRPLAESSPLEPATVYGLAKAHLGALTQGFCAAAGVSGAWARIFFVFGPGEGEDRLVPTVARALAAGGRAALTEGSQRRDYLYVGDVADALAALVASDLEGAVNVGSGSAMPVRDLAERVGAALGARELLDFGAVPRREGEAPRVEADVTRLEEELGWRPPWGLERGLELTVAWWRRAAAAGGAG